MLLSQSSGATEHKLITMQGELTDHTRISKYSDSESEILAEIRLGLEISLVFRTIVSPHWESERKRNRRIRRTLESGELNSIGKVFPLAPRLIAEPSNE